MPVQSGGPLSPLWALFPRGSMEGLVRGAGCEGTSLVSVNHPPSGSPRPSEPSGSSFGPWQLRGTP